MRVIGGAFAAIAKEMAGVLYRMSYSSIIRESEDLGAGIFDADGNELAESDSTPMFMGAMPKIVKGVISLLGDDIHEGDVILHNDPYLGATHSPDVGDRDADLLRRASSSASPAPRRTCSTSAAPIPGIAIDLVDNWSEGNIYRAVKLADRGVWQEGLWQPHPREHADRQPQPRRHPGDDRGLRARQPPLRSSCSRRYGKDVVLGAAQAWLSYSERMLRAEIAKVPDGVYETDVGWLDDDGRTRGVKLPVKVKVVIEGDEITIDLTGSSDEVPTGFNCPFEGTTVSAMSFIARMIFLDEVAYPVFVPQNEGMLKPVRSSRRRARSSTPTTRARASPASASRSAPSTSCCKALVAGRAGEDHGRELGAPHVHLLLRLQRAGGRVLGLPRGRRGLLRRPPGRATASTPSTA